MKKSPPPSLAVFDEQIRRNAQPSTPGTRAEWDATILRHVNPDSDGECSVIWSELDAATADDAIAAQVAYFSRLGRSFEWKYHRHDGPSNLPERLVAAGFEAGEPESVMVANAADIAIDVILPESIRIETITDAAGIARMVALHDQVFGESRPDFGESLLAQLTDSPDSMVPLLVLDGDRPVCSARIEFHRGTEFASLWGGGTLESHRGRGIYRALVAHRARLAVDRSIRYLHVDAMPDSRPILERLGFIELTTTTPYIKSV
ncbi:GNAT family N-acetyltransferase [Pendulispora brunnea]|uniref:GNAT family N-acetyltransferase n=1 Tax=Pendulispora brunnea TaxID=2905690 RepID=A0ABZ2KDW5_9BACT